MILFNVLGKWDPKKENLDPIYPLLISSVDLFVESIMYCLALQQVGRLKTMGGDLLISILRQMQTTEVLLANLQENVTIIRLFIVYPVNSGNACIQFVYIWRIRALMDFGERV